jgi:hypothetical protein
MPDSKTYPFVFELARNEYAVDKILRTHLADGRNRCSGCYPDERMRPQWPCIVHVCAAQARELLDADELLQRRRTA